MQSDRTLLRLDTLPSEIIRHILSQGDALNALLLSRVNRNLRSICTDPSIYIYVIKNSNGVVINATPPGSTESTRWPLLSCLHEVKDWQVCARWALADRYLLNSATSDGNDLILQQNIDRNYWKWFPELIATGSRRALEDLPYGWRVGHDYVNRQTELKLSTSPLASQELEYCSEVTVRLIFLAVCQHNARCGMSGYNYRMHEPSQPLTKYFPESAAYLIYTFVPVLQHNSQSVLNVLHSAISILQNTNMMTTWLSKTEQELHWTRAMITCIVVSAMLLGFARQCSSRWDERLGVNQTLGENQVPQHFDAWLGGPPGPANIPFQDLYQVDAPLDLTHTTAGLNGFGIRHLAKMTSTQFLEDGLWCGYFFVTVCVDGHENPNGYLDKAVHDLSLKITGDCADHCTIQGECDRLMVGRMSLTGTLFKRTGWAQLDADVMVEPGRRINSPWSIMMTPFGMIGTWKAGNNTASSAGWLWLWKRSWQPITCRNEPRWKHPAHAG